MAKHSANIYYQRCSYQTKSGGKWFQGIARVAAFDCNDVSFILNEKGNKVRSVYDYRLHSAQHGDATGIRIEA
jgi:hypothetical protein